MSGVTLAFPAFFSIEGEGSERAHVARPLLAPTVEARGRSAEAVTARLVEEVRKAVRQDMGLCRALSAIPDGYGERVQRLEVSGRAGRQPRNLRCVLVERGVQTWAIFPRLGPAVLPLAPGAGAVGLQDAIDAHVRRSKPPDEVLATWEEQGGDRVVFLTLRADVRWPPIEPELDLAALFQGAGGAEALDGEDELEAVGQSLKRRYPERLLQDHVPHPLADELADALFGREPAAIALLGAPGSGRTTLVHAALRRRMTAWIAEHGPDTGPVPDVWLVDPNRVISGQSIVGAWQRRFQAILGHLARVGGHRRRPDVLYLDNAVAVARVGRARGSEMTLANLLRPWLEQRRLPVVLEATPEEWRRLEELDRPLTDLFRVLRVPEPRREVAARMVIAKLPAIEAETGATIAPAALRELYALSERQQSGRVQPGAALDALEALARRRRGPVGVAEVRAAAADESGLQDAWLDGRTRLDPDDLRSRIAARLAGQPDAVELVLRCLLVVRAGLARPGRPVASALLVGPTGVGKTETARVLAGLMFRREGHLLRFDMNELVDADAPRRLIGDLWTEGALTSRVRHRPFSVVLFDEVEKAHPSVLDLLLQVLDEGRLTDGRGQRADFQRTVVLLTSNVGAAEIARTTGFERGGADLARAFRAAAERGFRPELINRIDQLIAYQPLSAEDLRKVAGLQARELLRREGLRRRTVFLDLPPAALDRLAVAAAGSTGARALKRAIEQEIVAPLAEAVLDHPPELPVLLRARVDTPGFEARTIPFTTRRVDPAVVEGAPSADEILEQLRGLEPAGGLVASAGPGGTTRHGSELVRELQRRLEPDEDEDEAADVALTDAQLWRVSAKGRAVRTFRGWRNFRPDWEAATTYRSVRAYLLAATEAARETPPPELREAEAVPAVTRAISAFQARALRAGERTVLVRARALTTEPDAFWWRFDAWAEHLERVISWLDARADLYRRDPTAGWVPSPDSARTAGGERAWRVVGAGAELIGVERGLHLLWVDDHPPLALQVEVGPDTGLDAPWPEPEEVVRLYLARELALEVVVHEVTDLRLGLTWPGLDALGREGYAPFAMEAR